jgi:hypothetical protein
MLNAGKWISKILPCVLLKVRQRMFREKHTVCTFACGIKLLKVLKKYFEIFVLFTWSSLPFHPPF